MAALLVALLSMAFPAGAAELQPTPWPWPSIAEMRTGYGAAVNHTFVVGDTRGSAEAFQRVLDTSYVASKDTLRAEDQAYVWVDLNGDGTDEVLLMIHGFGYCGSIGCSGAILILEDGQWTENARISLVDPIGIGSPRREGYATVYSMDMCAAWNGARYEIRGDDIQDGISIHPHACGKHYDRRLVNSIQPCNRCHLPDVYDRK